MLTFLPQRVLTIIKVFRAVVFRERRRKMYREATFAKRAVFGMLLALLMAFPLTANSKDKIRIGQAVSLSGPLATSNAVVSSPYYDLWVKDVNAEGGIYVKECGKKYRWSFSYMMISLI
jgi:hypothetical protein